MPDDTKMRGAMRRVQVIRQVVPEDVPQDIPEDVQQDAPQDAPKDITTPKPVKKQSSSPFPEKLSAGEPAMKEGPTEQKRGGFVLKIDEEAGDWIKQVRDAGGGITMGPKDGVIAIPSGGPRPKGFLRGMLSPKKEEEMPEDIFPKSFDEMKEKGREAMKDPFGAGAEEEDRQVENAIQKAMTSIRGLMNNIDRSLYGRRQDD